MFEKLRLFKQERQRQRDEANEQFFLTHGSWPIPGALYVPTAEFINPYADLTDEQKQAMVEQFEPPPLVAVKIDQEG